jgi:outer membrane protein OmpA-like peptidoglycan-associated protein
MSNKRAIFGSSAESDEQHWISVSDLMAGLMVIFLFIAITYIRPIVEVRNQIRDIAVTWNDSEVELYNRLREEFQDDLLKWNAELDQDTLSIKFKAPDVLFASGDTTLKPEFQSILGDFFPRYMAVLSDFKDSIDEVRIEGHTSSEWENAETYEQAYFSNMALSQGRTRSVLEYVLELPGAQPYKDWAFEHITANGLSSSHLVRYPDGKENHIASRRVEFRIRTNTKEQIVKILGTVSEARN